jgi:hypothetical protein
MLVTPRVTVNPRDSPSCRARNGHARSATLMLACRRPARQGNGLGNRARSCGLRLGVGGGRLSRERVASHPPLDPQDYALPDNTGQSADGGGAVGVTTCWLSSRMHAV